MSISFTHKHGSLLSGVNIQLDSEKILGCLSSGTGFVEEISFSDLASSAGLVTIAKIPFQNILDYGGVEGTSDLATTANDTAFAAAAAVGQNIYFPPGTYVFNSTINYDGITIVGSGSDGTDRTTILGGTGISASSPLVKIGRTSGLHNLRLAYTSANITDSETRGQRVLLDTSGASFILQRGSVIDRVRFDTCGTAITDGGNGCFSVTFGTIEIGSHSYRAVDIYGNGRTGNVWENIYINGGDTYTPVDGFYYSGTEVGGHIGILNVEHQDYTGNPVYFSRTWGMTIGNLHLEGIDVTTSDKGYVYLDQSSINIAVLSVINTRLTATSGSSIVQLGPTAITVASGSAFAAASTTSRLSIHLLHFKGLARPSASLYPSYPAGKTYLDSLTNFYFFDRDSGETGLYDVTVDEYTYATYNGATDAAVYQDLLGNSNPNGNIRFYGKALAQEPYVLKQSAVASSHTGNTTETALATITIPANSMGANGRIRLTYVASAGANNANAKTLRVRLNGIAGTAHQTLDLASGLSLRAQVEIANRNSASSQISQALFGGSTGAGWSKATAAVVTSAIDTTSDVDLVISVQLANSGDTVTLESYMVELMYAV